MEGSPSFAKSPEKRGVNPTSIHLGRSLISLLIPNHHFPNSSHEGRNLLRESMRRESLELQALLSSIHFELQFFF